MGTSLPSGTWGHAVFDGTSPNGSSVKTLKLYLVQGKGASPELRHIIQARDVGVADGESVDPYGAMCKCPPGDYIVGEPEVCATRDPHDPGKVEWSAASDDEAYGCFFTPLQDGSPGGGMAQHGRAGIGVHGGGSALPDPFALHQGWYDTLGCIRLQNYDNEYVFVPFVRTVQAAGGHVLFTVYWGPRGGA